ncbi:TPA: alginate lyase family protein [Escherichia coli]|nr:heparinase II/III family protein [Escherichia coli]
MKLRQIINRLIRKFKKIKICYSSKYELRQRVGQWLCMEMYPQTYYGNMTFKFLNFQLSINSWNDHKCSKLWLYNLHYFDDLNAFNSKKRKILHLELIHNWIENNPPLKGNGWEPYPTSLRIVNWVKYILSNNINDDNILRSLYIQAQVLSQMLEFHLFGNHLFANAKALIFAGVFFSGKQAEYYLELGLNILDKELNEQILSDGGHFERSPMYHNIILNDILDLCNLAQVYEIVHLRKRLNIWTAKIYKMLEFSSAMSHPDGNISFFNDSTFGISPTHSQLMLYAKSLFDINEGDLISSDNPINYIFFKESGYVSASTTNSKVIMDIAKVGPDYIPGHAHADTLSYELSIFGERVIVNSGINQYGLSELRLEQRKTKSHNTIEVNNMDSSEVWSGFRVAKRANPKVIDISLRHETLLVEGSHDGYKKFSGKIIHTRKWILSDNQLIIDDFICGTFQTAISYLHFHPDISLDVIDGGVRLKLKSGKIVTLYIPCPFTVDDSFWYPEFGVSRLNKRIIIHLIKDQLTVTFRW